MKLAVKNTIKSSVGKKRNYFPNNPIITFSKYTDSISFVNRPLHDLGEIYSSFLASKTSSVLSESILLLGRFVFQNLDVASVSFLRRAVSFFFPSGRSARERDRRRKRSRLLFTRTGKSCGEGGFSRNPLQSDSH